LFKLKSEQENVLWPEVDYEGCAIVTHCRTMTPRSMWRGTVLASGPV